MPTLVFWNLDGNVSAATVAGLARQCDADILILAENKNGIPDILRELNHDASRLYFSDIGQSDRLTILTRFLPDRSILIRDSPGVSIRHYTMPLGDSFLVVAVHLSSKLRKKTEDQILGTTRLARFIRAAEENVGHARTLIVGDLNMNPFEVGMVGSEGLHGIMDRRIASTMSRVVQGESCRFFYNPMWSMLGDGGAFPPGTYFYNSGTEVNYFWNMFDQVLVRPELLDSLATDSVSIVTEIQGATLLTDIGRPNRYDSSDHLPIVCRLSEIQETVYA
jgi:hypothetical protein